MVFYHTCKTYQFAIISPPQNCSDKSIDIMIRQWNELWKGVNHEWQSSPTASRENLNIYTAPHEKLAQNYESLLPVCTFSVAIGCSGIILLLSAYRSMDWLHPTFLFYGKLCLKHHEWFTLRLILLATACFCRNTAASLSTKYSLKASTSKWHPH